MKDNLKKIEKQTSNKSKIVTIETKDCKKLKNASNQSRIAVANTKCLEEMKLTSMT